MNSTTKSRNIFISKASLISIPGNSPHYKEDHSHLFLHKKIMQLLFIFFIDKFNLFKLEYKI